MIDNMKALGCQDEGKIMLAHQTFLELSEVECLKNLCFGYNSELDILYIVEHLQNTFNVYLPVPSSFVFTPCWIRIVQDKLSHIKPKSIVLVIREGDSTFVRYKLTAELITSQIDCKKKTT